MPGAHRLKSFSLDGFESAFVCRIQEPIPEENNRCTASKYKSVLKAKICLHRNRNRSLPFPWS